MTKIVGNQDRSEFVLNPVEAFHRGEKLDRMLKPTLPAVPRKVSRGTHGYFNRIDAVRALEIAVLLNLAAPHGR